MAGTTVRTIRYYHQLGLLAVPDSETTWRDYGFAHLTRLMRIRWLVESGVPLSEVPHLLQPPGNAGEAEQAGEDLTAVLASMDERIATLERQRECVAALRERIRTEGRFTPLPAGVVRMYAALLARPLPAEMRVAVSRERDLLELASYHGGLPAEVENVVNALGPSELDRLGDLWAVIHEIDQASRTSLTPHQAIRIEETVKEVLELARDAEPEATRRLLARAGELDRPAVRATVRLAYPSRAYRHVIGTVLAIAAHRADQPSEQGAPGGGA